MDQTRVIMYYCNGERQFINEFTSHLMNYLDDESRYLVTHEIGSKTKKPHFHVIAEMSNEQYTKYADAILRKKYKLSGSKKEYGRVKQVRDCNKAISYILKDLAEKDAATRMLGYNSNLPDDVIVEFLEKSFKKSEDKDHIELAIESVPQLPYQYEYTDTDIICRKIMILEYFKNNNLDCNIQKVDRIFNMYLMRHEKLSANQIYEIMRQNRNNRL